MTFASSGFANSGYQTDQAVLAGLRPRRNYYEIRGKLYLLSDEELNYLVHKILADEPTPKASKKPIRLRAPREWTPPPTQDFDWGVWDDLVVEAKTKNYPALLDILQRVQPSDDDEALLLLMS